MTHAFNVFDFALPALALTLHWFAALLVFAEALNKLERTDPLAAGLHARMRLVLFLKAIAWMLLATGAMGSLITPLLHLPAPTLQDACVMAGFAVLIVRSRLKESVT